jgi:hypothetical protein
LAVVIGGVVLISSIFFFALSAGSGRIGSGIVRNSNDITGTWSVSGNTLTTNIDVVSIRGNPPPVLAFRFVHGAYGSVFDYVLTSDISLLNNSELQIGNNVYLRE